MFDNFAIEEMKELQINVLFTDYFDIDGMIAEGFPVKVVDDLNIDGQELFYKIVLKNQKEMEGEKVWAFR